ncbi:MAG: Ltp family lipoprotein [Eubacterium sp.]|nr:Ltp family lipoprotein [Eubacterium sp.]
MKQIIKKIVSVALIIVIAFGATYAVGEAVQQPKTVKAASYGKRMAKQKAKEYLRAMAFSKKGLYDQLRFEGFTKKQAKYGVKHCGANWKKQAYKKAKEYLRSMSFSKKGLYDQLRFEGFTKKQAKYGVRKAYR